MTDEEVREKFVRMTSPRLAVPDRARLQERSLWNLDYLDLAPLFGNSWPRRIPSNTKAAAECEAHESASPAA